MLTVAWTSVLLGLGWLGFGYVGYPICLWLLNRISPRPLKLAATDPPSLSVIIAVHNGERELERKLESTLALSYAGEREIIVTSDGSTDRTHEIVEAFSDRGIRLIVGAEQQGKEAAQSRAIEQAKGEVLVFTDVAARLNARALEAIAEPFADPSVGAVSSEDAVDSDEGEGAYVRYEMFLRRLETSTTSLVGLSGSFFAVRRELAQPWAVDLASDFRTALEAVRRGYRAVSAPAATASFEVVTSQRAEWRRKVRTVRRGLAVLSRNRDLLSPRFGRAAFSLWGHKVARFTSPLALVLVALGSAMGSRSSLVLATLLVSQGVAYVIGGASLVSGSVAKLRVPRLAGFFMIVNASMLVAWAYHLTGQRAVKWAPTQR